MKTKFAILLIISAITTLSFTFGSITNQEAPDVKKPTLVRADNEPIGGFLAEDEL